MSSNEYIVNYVNIRNVAFPTAEGMRKYLKAEQNTWEEFLQFASSNNALNQDTWNFNRRHSKDSYFSNFDTLESHLSSESPSSFNQATEGYSRVAFFPPPSTSSEGQLIIGLWKNGRTEHALYAYLAFILEEADFPRNRTDNLAGLFNQGKALLGAAYVTEVLPYHAVSSQKISGAVRSAEGQIKTLSDEVSKAVQINTEHQTQLSEKRTFFKRRARRLEKFILEREKRRGLEHEVNRESAQTLFAELMEKQSKSFNEFLGMNKLSVKQELATHAEQIDKQSARFDELQDLFMTQLRLKAPVALWEKRQTEHERASKRAFLFFIAFSIVSVAIAIGVPWGAGDYIADSFSRAVCLTEEPTDCQLTFSAKGPLTITGLLVVTSLFLWLIRLQYRVFLSERHLALDAREKKAFAEVFLALKQDAKVGSESEAIVLASLFRPTQDGIIKDNDNGMDLSAAASLAKHLSKVDK